MKKPTVKTTKRPTAKSTAKAKQPAKATTKPIVKAKGEKVDAAKRSRFTGMKLFPTDAAKGSNPRREKSHGHRSLEVIRQKPSVTYEEFIRAGGRRVDLAWDVLHGNAGARR